jgi:hypothetical protein
MRALVTSLIVGIAIAGCGAAPGHETTTPTPAASLRPLEVSRPEGALRSVQGANALVEIRVIVTNPNSVPVTMRRVDGNVLLDGEQAAHIEVEGAEPIDPNAERAFVFNVSVPLQLLTSVRGDQYVARGTLHADGGSGDGALQSPFEFSGPVPRP